MNDNELDARQTRRFAAEDRFLGRMERAEEKAAKLIGELCREGRAVYYVNVTDRFGQPTGKVKESTNFYVLVEYLRRNKYI
jgi:hypothetical protein